MNLNLSINNQPQYTYTVQDFINQGKSIEMTYYNTSLLEKYTGDNIEIEYSRDNIIYDYIEEMEFLSKDIVMTEEEFRKYRYNPQLLSYDVYGTTDLAFAILALNGTCNMKDFNNRKIKMLYKTDMFEVLSEIYNAESNTIKFNRAKLEEGSSY